MYIQMKMACTSVFIVSPFLAPKSQSYKRLRKIERVVLRLGNSISEKNRQREIEINLKFILFSL